jgi:hypothetical protein
MELFLPEDIINYLRKTDTAGVIVWSQNDKDGVLAKISLNNTEYLIKSFYSLESW